MMMMAGFAGSDGVGSRVETISGGLLLGNLGDEQIEDCITLFPTNI
jgi:hypothetical protein